MIERLINFIKWDIWRLRGKVLQGPRGFFLRGLRILLISFKEFSSDQCSLRASALTFFTLLSIVPIFAMAFGIAKGFGLEKYLKERLLENMYGQQDVLVRVIEFSENLLQDASGGIIAGIGVVFLFWSVIKVLGNIEKSFNDIWGIKKQRTWGQKFTDYLALMLIVPIFFLAASSATVFVVTEVTNVTSKVVFLGPAILALFNILPLAVFCGLLTYLYIFLPNGKINFDSALLGGFVAGTVYQIVQWIYIRFQIGISNAGVIYGSFAALPLFLIWLQTSWFIVLYGAELAFAHQNESTFEFEPDCLKASYKFKKLATLMIAQHSVQRFAEGKPPLSAAEIATGLEMPIRLARELLHRLMEAGILTEIQTQSERNPSYQPARDINEITLHYVIEKMEAVGSEDVPLLETPELEKLRHSLKDFDQTLSRLPENILLKDLNQKQTNPKLVNAH